MGFFGCTDAELQHDWHRMIFEFAMSVIKVRCANASCFRQAGCAHQEAPIKESLYQQQQVIVELHSTERRHSRGKLLEYQYMQVLANKTGDCAFGLHVGKAQQ